MTLGSLNTGSHPASFYVLPLPDPVDCFSTGVLGLKLQYYFSSSHPHGLVPQSCSLFHLLLWTVSEIPLGLRSQKRKYFEKFLRMSELFSDVHLLLYPFIKEITIFVLLYCVRAVVRRGKKKLPKLHFQPAGLLVRLTFSKQKHRNCTKLDKSNP